MPAQIPWLLISDVFKGQWTKTSEKLGYGKPRENGSDTRKYDPHIPAFRRLRWYADQVSTPVAEGKQLDYIKVDLLICLLKPKWVVQFYDKMQNEPHIVLNGWLKSGIMDVYLLTLALKIRLLRDSKV